VIDLLLPPQNSSLFLDHTAQKRESKPLAVGDALTGLMSLPAGMFSEARTFREQENQIVFWDMLPAWATPLTARALLVTREFPRVAPEHDLISYK
jgi:hypothetical protein